VAGRVVGFLFDENAPPRLARSLRELGEAAYHVRDLGLAQSPDAAVLRYAGERELSVVTADRMILRRPHERAVIAEAGVTMFFLNDTVAGLCSISRTLFRHWPEMKRLARAEPRPSLYLVRETTLSRIPRRNSG
jgi:hypothetical protein